MIAAALLGLVAWVLWVSSETANPARPPSSPAVADETAPEAPASHERQPANAPVEPQLAHQAVAPDVPPVASEIDLGELRGTELPPGMIEARVIQGEDAVRATVELGRYGAAPITSEALSSTRETIERKATDKGGIAQFSGLDPGSYAVRAELADGSSLEARATLEEGAAHGERVWLVFGAGGIRGRVFAADGAPRPDSLVVVSAWRMPMRREVVTAWDGSYSVGGLRSGDFSVSLLSTAGGRITEEASVHVRLAPGEWKTVDLGSSSGLVQWTGTLRLSDGQPATGPEQLELREVESGGASVVQVGADGRIAAELAPGRYGVRIWSLGDPLELGEVAIDPGQGELDLIVPGTELTGLVRWADGELVPGEDRTARFTQVWLKSRAERQRTGFASTDDTGRFVHRALSAGEWAVTVHPGSIRGAPLDGLVVRVVEGAARVVLDLELTSP